MSKIRVAFFDFACCEGCQLQVANMGSALSMLLSLGKSCLKKVIMMWQL